MPGTCTPTPVDPLCLGQKIVGGIGNAAVGGAMDKLANAIAEGVENTLKTLATFWLNIPSPTGLGLSSTIVSMQDWLGPITATVAVLGVIIALTYMGWTGQLRAGGEAGAMLVKLIIVSGAGTTGVAILIASGDAFSPWIIQQATGAPFSGQASAVVTKTMLTGNGLGATLLVGQLLYLAAAMQIVFMIIRSALLIVMMVIWPTVAASTATEAGRTWFKRLNGYVLAWLLYKPVAAVIYATGFLVVKDPIVVKGATPETNSLMALLMGSTIIVLAALSLPALIKFVAPIAGAGVSSAFSGAAAVGAVATGALALTGVGAAAAGAGAGAAAATGSINPPPPSVTADSPSGGTNPGGGGGTGDDSSSSSGGPSGGSGGGATPNGGSDSSSSPESGGNPPPDAPPDAGSGSGPAPQPQSPPSGGPSGGGAVKTLLEMAQGGAHLAGQAADEMTDDPKNDSPSGPTGA